MPFDQTLWSNVEQNLAIFFIGYIVKALLGLRPLVYCTFCEKVILNEKEIGNDTSIVPVYQKLMKIQNGSVTNVWLLSLHDNITVVTKECSKCLVAFSLL